MDGYTDGYCGILKSDKKSLRHPMSFSQDGAGRWCWEIALNSNHEIMGKWFASREDAERSFKKIGFIIKPKKD